MIGLRKKSLQLKNDRFQEFEMSSWRLEKKNRSLKVEMPRFMLKTAQIGGGDQSPKEGNFR